MVPENNTLNELKEFLYEYDSDQVEAAYGQLIYEGTSYDGFSQLVSLIIAGVRSMYHYEEDADLTQYNNRATMLARMYKNVTAEEVYRFAFPEDVLQVCDEVDSKNGVGNAIRMDIVNKWETDEYGQLHCRQSAVQTVVTDDLRGVLVCPKKVNKENLLFSNFNLNTYFGNRRLTAAIDKIYGLIVEVDDVKTVEQINYLLAMVNDKKVPTPNYIVNSGHGCHIYYIFDTPICFHEHSFDVYPVITNVLNAIKNMYWIPNVTDAKPEHLDINKGYTVIGTHNRKNKDLIVTAYQVSNVRCSLEYLRSYINVDANNRDYDISFPRRSKYTKYEAATLYPHWAVQRFPELFDEEERKRLLKEVEELKVRENNIERAYSERTSTVCNVKLYLWFLNLLHQPQNIKHGYRYHCMVALAIYGYKCAISKEEVEQDLKELLPLLNSVEKVKKDGAFELTETDVKNALSVYKFDKTSRYTWKWIKDFTGIDYEPKTKRRDKPLSQAEHLMLARESLNNKYPNGSWRGNSSGETKQKIVDFIIENKDADIKMCIEQSGCSQSSVYKYWKMCRKELGLDFGNREASADMIKQFRTEHPTATKSQCIKELGLSKPTVYKHWC